MNPWEKLIERPQLRGHFVQLYKAGDLALARNVSQYLFEGLKRGEGCLVIATDEHRAMFCERLGSSGTDVRAAIRDRQLVLCDAQETMSRFMVNGKPDWTLFRATATDVIREVRPTAGSGGLRAYGEMVALLWNVRQYAAAIRLEQLWNRLLAESAFSLYCAYAIDVFGKDFHAAALDGVLCTHTHLVPAEPNGKLETAINSAMDEVFGAGADGLKTLIQANYRPSWAVMPTAESMLLWMRRNLPDQADRIVARAQHHYEALSPAGAIQ